MRTGVFTHIDKDMRTGVFTHIERDMRTGVCISTSYDHRWTPCPVAAIHTIFKLAKRAYCVQLVCVSVCVFLCVLCDVIHGGGRGRWSG